MLVKKKKALCLLRLDLQLFFKQNAGDVYWMLQIIE